MKQIWKMSLLIAGLIILDQITKGLVQSNFQLGESIPVLDGFFNLTYVRNPGAAFGMLGHAPNYIRRPLFLFIPVVACIGLVVLIWKSRNENRFLNLAYSLILAGAVGNLIDRFSMDYVVDFFDFYIGRSHYPAFNIADSCISIAAMMLIYDYFRELIQNRKNAASSQN
jgi:signal peptidase II